MNTLIHMNILLPEKKLISQDACVGIVLYEYQHDDLVLSRGPLMTRN